MLEYLPSYQSSPVSYLDTLENNDLGIQGVRERVCMCVGGGVWGGCGGMWVCVGVGVFRTSSSKLNKY